MRLCHHPRLRPSPAIADASTRRPSSATVVSGQIPTAAKPSHLQRAPPQQTLAGTARLSVLLPRLLSVDLTLWCFGCATPTPSPSTSSPSSTLLPRLYSGDCGVVMLLLPGLAVPWLGWLPPLLRLRLHLVYKRKNNAILSSLPPGTVAASATRGTRPCRGDAGGGSCNGSP